MKPYYQDDLVTLFHGDCREVLKTLPDNSVDSIVTDPPYELGFMGKKWDNSGVAYDVTVWQECLRVLKPGGHVLAFGGSRTWHRLAVAVEDAGFELRDSIAWLYGSGFPKSLDVSKAIDKSQGQNQARQLQFTAWMRASGLTASKARDVLFEAGLITEKSNQASHYFAETIGSQPAIATAEMFRALRPYLPPVPEEIERLVAERTGIEWTAYKQREVIGQRVTGAAMSGKKSGLAVGTGGTDFGSGQNLVNETAPATSEAKAWEGWGTALKPAFEPVVVGRKPLVGTVAENVLEWGVGGLNIDGSRIGMKDGDGWDVPIPQAKTAHPSWTSGATDRTGVDWTDKRQTPHVQGRWPANVILDKVTAGLLDEQSGVSKSGKPGVRSADGFNASVYGKGMGIAAGDANGEYGDSGGASRFFYVAKASKRDRNEGLEDLPKFNRYKKGGVGGTGGKRDVSVAENATPVSNFHPTVKPTQLMRYLIKLVTPPGGTVLDPFTGSGSTGKAALLDGFQFVGAELTEEYLPIIEGRLRWASEQEAETDDTLF